MGTSKGFIGNKCRKIVWLFRSLRRQINIFGGGISGTKNEFFETKCRKIKKINSYLPYI